MKVKQLFTFIILVSGLFTACYTDTTIIEPSPVGNYSTGVFVVNAGPWGGTGTISWYNPVTKEVQDSIFEKANHGAVLGQFVQSLTLHNGKAYIVVNGANRIVIVDAVTFEYQDTIGGLALPRFFLPVSNDIAYVSQWGLDGISGSIAKIDLNTNTVIKTIPTGSGPEKMTLSLDGQELIVANSGGYGTDSTIVSFPLNNEDQVVKTVISGQRNPCCYHPGATIFGTTAHVMCKGDWLDANAQGWFGKPFGAFEGFPIPKGCDDMVYSRGGYYFTSGTAIYASTFDFEPFKIIDQPAYGFNYYELLGYFYCADAKDFSSAGEVVIKLQNGTIIDTFRAGIAPGEIVFVF